MFKNRIFYKYGEANSNLFANKKTNLNNTWIYSKKVKVYWNILKLLAIFEFEKSWC